MSDRYTLGFNDGIFSSIKFLESVAKDFENLNQGNSDDADLLKEMAVALRGTYKPMNKGTSDD